MKIQQKQNSYMKPENDPANLYTKNKKVYDVIQAKIHQDKIVLENTRLITRLNKL
jgi:hypothetical protein